MENKKTTIEDLAGMVERGFDETHQRLDRLDENVNRLDINVDRLDKNDKIIIAKLEDYGAPKRI